MGKNKGGISRYREKDNCRRRREGSKVIIKMHGKVKRNNYTSKITCKSVFTDTVSRKFSSGLTMLPPRTIDKAEKI